MLRVGILSGNPPFSFIQNDVPKGIAVDIWNQYTKDYQIDVISDNPEFLLEKIRQNELDVLVGPFSMSHQRVQTIEFSKPFYISKLRLYTKESSMNWPQFTITAFIILSLIIAIVSVINHKSFWETASELIENFINREDVLDIKGAFGKTVNTAVKIFSFCFTIIIVSIITYIISLYKKTNEIDIKEMKNKRIGHIESKYFSKLINDRNMIPVGFKNHNDLKQAFLTKKVDGVLSDEFTFKEFFLNDYKHSDVIVLDDYGFVFRDPKEIKKFNLFLIQLQESENTAGICSRYLDQKDVIYCQV